MKILFLMVVALSIVMPLLSLAQEKPGGKIRIGIVKNALTGLRETPEPVPGPGVLETGGLSDVLQRSGCILERSSEARLSPEEEGEYGAWNRIGLANGHLGEMVAANRRDGLFTIGLLANCNSSVGMLAGLQHSGKGRRPLKVGMVWIDAHADFNTPETSLSGMLGGMPVAVATGQCLTRLRLKAGLEPALPVDYVLMLGVRDTDPLEQELLDRHRVAVLPVEEIRKPDARLRAGMERLSRLTDLIYVHIDMDILDPSEVAGSNYPVEGGPTSGELAAALELLFGYEKTAALGIASYPAGKDEDGLALKAAYRLVEGAVRGLQHR